MAGEGKEELTRLQWTADSGQEKRELAPSLLPLSQDCEPAGCLPQGQGNARVRGPVLGSPFPSSAALPTLS